MSSAETQYSVEEEEDPLYEERSELDNGDEKVWDAYENQQQFDFDFDATYFHYEEKDWLLYQVFFLRRYQNVRGAKMVDFYCEAINHIIDMQFTMPIYLNFLHIPDSLFTKFTTSTRKSCIGFRDLLGGKDSQGGSPAHWRGCGREADRKATLSNGQWGQTVEREKSMLD
ncbi:hypothetical protein N431DRAFT_457057 [Stipitochalara longipes BDJ]|nr:hypothetical protein N431DRAFT_457057 [Stipitochalara longipes BDJ]